jgi:hypothetical protein
MFKKTILFFVLNIAAFGPLFGQIAADLRWAAPTRHEINEDDAFYRLNCSNCAYEGVMGSQPIFAGTLPGRQQLEVSEVITENIPREELLNLRSTEFSERFVLEQQYVTIRKQSETHYKLTAVRKNPATGQIERLLSFRLETRADGMAPTTSPSFRLSTASNSVLSSGNWYKIGILNDGMYKITPAFLADMGIPVNSIDPRNIRIYGNGGGMLPEANNLFRFDDLVENPILVSGESDGSFDPGDFVLFYGEGPHKWRHQGGVHPFRHEFNLYADTNYYFLTIGNGPGLRINTQPNPPVAANYTSNSFDLLVQHQRDETNLIRSGRRWYGETFDLTTIRPYNFNLTNRVPGTQVTIRAAVAARNLGVPSGFTIRANGTLLGNININAVTSYYLDLYMRDGELLHTFNPTSDNISLSIAYNKPNNFSLGWLDFIEIYARARLQRAGFGDQLLFRDQESIAAGRITQFNLDGFNITDQIWDITRLDAIRAMPLTPTTTGVSFRAATDSLKTFIAFSGNNFPAPMALGPVANQNLHAVMQADLVIVAPPQFLVQANRLAGFHQTTNNYSTVVVTPEQIYNEFSSGRQDITAIRGFIKMLYDRAPAGREPRFLLLFGSSSYDYKSRIAGNANLVPTFQSPNSNDPLSSYCADSYFGLLDDQEGAFAVGSADRMDIAIGRLPAKTVDQARQLVDKIINYHNPIHHGDWKNQVMLVADDGDFNIHINDTEVMSGHIDNRYPSGIIRKVYFDAYRRVSRPGGVRYPDVNRDINARMNLGVFVVGYMGHGGVNGWAEERVLTIPEIQAWNSGSKLPLMVTATCEFTRYDNPTFTSAGEWVLLNPQGGAIALLTTTRVTFTNFNFTLSSRIYRDELFRKVNGDYQTLGEVYMRASNPELNNVNTRNFCLLGDPAMRLAYPQEVGAVTHINQVQVNAIPDTLRALALVTISGDVRDQNNQLISGFNGVLNPTVLDKQASINTLANDPSSSVRAYKEFRNIIYRGRASVRNGEWRFSFIVPRDIAYNYDFGRINLYATNNQLDAAGDFRNIIVGGADTNFVQDLTAPEIRLYMNDVAFVNGGITNPNPILIAELSDSSGINTVGNGIGRDITLIKNQEVNRPIILNEFYEAALDDYMRGEIRYPFFKLEPGNYRINLKAWDVHNNSGEAGLDFVVADDAGLTIKNLLNYPNPFTTNTKIHFDHNRPNEPLDVIVQIYTVSGKLVKTIKQTISTTGFHAELDAWDGLDDFGDRIGRGVYVYRIRLRTAAGENTQDTQKLVILR